MTEPPSPFYLVPEVALLEQLPEHLRKRFIHALTLMHKHLDDQLSWEQIATKSAISPYHFHRQFTDLFHETPGHYLGRLRLQRAVNLLMKNAPWTITEIAQHCGFSSSQALGKALKRELGVTAKQIRKMGITSTANETVALMNKLAHPGEGNTLEQELAQAMPTELVWYPQRGMKKIALDDRNWDKVFNAYGEKAVRLMGITPIKDIEKSWEEIETVIGDWQVNNEEYDNVIQEGYFLCCDVYVASDIGYIAAIESLFQRTEQEQLSVDVTGVLVEMIRDIDLSDTGGVTFSLQIPIKVK
ncbi:helix-turn-helix domain-containing protein [Enterovibrio norvegicus]|uniref:helix-turn-helix domain-containing protein n=1 Tax=Enterovibrio norvegicus TaxID=188144 RepID=UPI0010BEA8BB|nr:AraC family transcriptional regulator [Enterovibrio norvegicus]TKF33961.1 helix-turn-helix transcriptional regulator [Enterovibrio norvegicus]